MHSDDFDRSIIEAMIVCVNNELVKNTQIFYLQSDATLQNMAQEQHIRKNMEQIIEKAQCRKILFTIRDDFIGPQKELIQSATGQAPTS